MSTLGYVTPVGQQSKEGFHALRRTTEGLLYYTKVDKDSTDTIDLSNGSPDPLIQLPTSGSYVEANEGYIDTQLFAGDGSDTTFDLTVPVPDATRIRVHVNQVLQKETIDFTYSSPTITFNIAPANGAQIAVGKINKGYKNNTSDKYQQYLFEDGDATYFIDSDGYLIKRENKSYGQTAITDDFTTAEGSTYSTASTSYQDAV
tara:strand:+ start:613 stop:1221 length:609 start_codon:yes stop_codon:yes gene_type:complete